jgi:hypothetical protein
MLDFACNCVFVVFVFILVELELALVLVYDENDLLDSGCCGGMKARKRVCFRPRDNASLLGDS